MGDSESESGSGTWLVTYSDLVTLLLVFFVLLYTLTPGVDKSTFNDFISHFQSQSSVIQQKGEPNEESGDHTLREEWKEVKKFLKEEGLKSEVQIQQIKNGVKVTLSDSLTFNSGSAILLPAAKKVLKEIASKLGGDVKEVNTQGHTDNVPIASRSRYRSNWHLGAARAVSVVQFLNDHSEVAPEKYEASSFGKYKPIDTNDSPGGRRHNRRVEIYIRYNGAPPDMASKL